MTETVSMEEPRRAWWRRVGDWLAGVLTSRREAARRALSVETSPDSPSAYMDDTKGRIRAGLAWLAEVEGSFLAHTVGGAGLGELKSRGKLLVAHLHGSTVYTADQILTDAEIWLGQVAALRRRGEWLGFLGRLLLVALLVGVLVAAFHVIRNTDYFTSTLSLASFFQKQPLSDEFIRFFPNVLLICMVAATLYASTAVVFTRARFGIAFAVATYLCTVPVALGLALYHTAAITETTSLRKEEVRTVETSPKGRQKTVVTFKDVEVSSYAPKEWSDIFSQAYGLARLFKPFLVGDASDVYALAFFLVFTLPVSLVVLFGILAALVQGVLSTLSPIRQRPPGRLENWGGAVLKATATIGGTSLAVLAVVVLAIKLAGVLLSAA